MKSFVVFCMLVAVALSEEVRDKRGAIIGSPLLASGIAAPIATPLGISTLGLAPRVGLVGPGLVGPGIVGPGIVGSGLVAPGLVGSGLVAPGLVGSRLVAPGLIAPGIVGSGIVGSPLLGKSILL